MGAGAGKEVIEAALDEQSIMPVVAVGKAGEVPAFAKGMKVRVIAGENNGQEAVITGIRKDQLFLQVLSTDKIVRILMEHATPV